MGKRIWLVGIALLLVAGAVFARGGSESGGGSSSGGSGGSSSRYRVPVTRYETVSTPGGVLVIRIDYTIEEKTGGGTGRLVSGPTARVHSFLPKEASGGYYGRYTYNVQYNSGGYTSQMRYRISGKMIRTRITDSRTASVSPSSFSFSKEGGFSW